MGRLYDARTRSLGQIYHSEGTPLGGSRTKIPKAAKSTSIATIPSIINPINKTTWGVNVINPPYGHGAHVNSVFCTKQLGLTEVRLGLQWSTIQPTSINNFDWTEADDAVTELTNGGLSIVVVLETTGATWANGGYGLPYGGFPPGGTQAYYDWVARYANFMYILVSRYKGLVRMWEIGNECNTSGHFFIEGNNTGSAVHVQWYAYWYNAMRAAVKAADPLAGVSLSSVYAISFWPGSNGISGYNWYDQCLNTYHCQTDAVSIHPYSIFAQSDDPTLNNYPNNSFGNDIARIQALMRSSGIADKELMVTEWGYFNHDDATNAAYIKAGCELIRDLYSIEVLGPNNAGVTSVHYYHLFNDRINEIDSNLTGLFRYSPIVGPSQIQLAGLAMQNFMNELHADSPRKLTPFAPSTSPVAIRMIQTGVNLFGNADPATSDSIARLPAANHTVSDSFSTLSGAWTNIRGTASAVSGNYQSSVAPSAYYKNDYVPPVNQRYIITLTTVSNQCFGLMRYDPVTDTGYKFAAEPGQAVLYKVVNGIDTPLITVTGITWATNDTVAATVSGTTLTLLRNGGSIGTIRDGSYLSANRIGVGTGDTTDKINAIFVTELPDASGTLLQPAAAISSSNALALGVITSGNQTGAAAVATSTSIPNDVALNRIQTAPVATATSTAKDLSLSIASAQSVTPSVATSASTPKDPNFNISLKAPLAISYSGSLSGGLKLNQTHHPAVATSASTAITPTLAAAPQSVTPSVAISGSTAFAGSANRSIVPPVATSTSTALSGTASAGGGGVSDDFAGTGALSAAWTSVNGSASRVSGEYAGAGSSDIYYRNDFSPGSDQTINITLGANISGWLMYGRLDTALGNGYFLTLTNNNWVVYRFDSSVPTGLFSSGTVSFVAGDIVSFKFIGSTIQVLKNGVVDGSGTDATYSAGGRVAIGTQLAGDTIRDFSATSP